VVPRWLSLGIVALAAGACRDKGANPIDASSDDIRVDGPSPLTIDIAVTGCASYDPATATCRGSAPLTLSFAPVGSPELTQFRWDFGDGTPTTSERAPTHTFAHADSYEVTLKGRSDEVGSISPPRPVEVIVGRLPLGSACDVDDQCDSGLACLCTPGSGCSAAFGHGICSRSCAASACGANAVCATVPIGPPSDAGAPTPFCTASCAVNQAACAPGLVCQTLFTPPGAGTPGWTRGCLPLGAAVDLGGPCRDANDALTDGACTTGFCANIGALGVCSATCDDTHPCPAQAACTVLADGRRLCLLTCAGDTDCGRDPLLACVAARTPDGRAGVTACTPRSCTADDVCLPSGRCGPDGFCIRK
jgi:hypothetical protein